MEKDRRKFTREFKLNAVELSFSRENIKELANELDVWPELIHLWRSEFASYQGKSFPGNGNPKEAMNKPFFSVVMPTFNRAKFLDQSIKSVIQQKFDDWELIIVDDGSQDNTNEVIKEYKDNRIKYFYQRNAGVSAARNFGIKKCNGLYVCFLDDDDQYLEHHLSFLHSEITKRSYPVTLLSTNLYIAVNESLTEKPFVDYGATNSFEILPRLQISCLHSAVLEKHLLNENLSIREDHEFCDRIRRDFGIIALDEFTVIYHKHGENITANTYKVRKGLEKTTHFYIRDRKRISKDELTKLHDCYLFLLMYYVRQKNVFKTLQYFIKTILILPFALFIKPVLYKYLIFLKIR